ncbi:MAG: hypothetical protein M1819_000273 [Sarea resinae]|nr:MAG: hypothetical protein M1819_000273 [Sarea resinae]
MQSGATTLPTTEILLTSRDRESGAFYADLASSEDFLGSHVLRIPPLSAPGSGKEIGNFRDNKGKARQFTTVNGRTVVVKDVYVYSNKGFKTLNQAQLLNDVLYTPDGLDPQQWLIYYISKPLLGSCENVSIIPAFIPDPSSRARTSGNSRTSARAEGQSSTPRSKDVKSFNDLLNHFPMIARQMQPGLERLFKEFGAVFEKPLPRPPSPSPSTNSKRKEYPASLHGSIHSAPEETSNGHVRSPFQQELYFDDDEDEMRRALETAVTAAIDLFQLVDKQQLSLLGATTDLTGPLVERLIERYVAEQVHDSLLFPRVCAIKRLDDLELESRIRQMSDVDISQVGIPIEGGRQGKQDLMLRLSRGVEEFRRMGVAGSPQEMMDILLATEKVVTRAELEDSDYEKSNGKPAFSASSEKSPPMLTINADTLVSLLLVVVIRAQVRHLFARLSYMRHFIFIDDVESGEMGYALSTFEAVLSYLGKDAGGLRQASRRNRKLWQATKNGNIQEMKAVLDPTRGRAGAADVPEEIEELEDGTSVVIQDDLQQDGECPLSLPSDNDTEPDSALETHTPGLAHVFPFQISHGSSPEPELVRRPSKRVSMDTRSMSSSSGYSVGSRATLDSRGSGFEGDTSVERLSGTHDASGDSVMMMAVEHRQPKALRYLLGLKDFFTLDAVLEDANNEGTTLLSAAVQLGHTELIDIILDFIFRIKDEHMIVSYLERQDNRGRSIAHYLFNAPHLITRIGHLLPWKQKDRNGQTPLFALCRSYDHSDYRNMVMAALTVAREAQRDGLPLHLDDHVDSKGNTLLHIVSDPRLASRIIYHCDSDVNATNDKRFTPLMVASKYGRVDMVRELFGDPRVDIYAKELRGLTAVELAKDDEVRNRIDDLTLLFNAPGPGGRITAVVRSFFVEDATIRLVLKSGAPNGDSTITVTTCRRSLTDFETLAKWLVVEHPASWLPSISGFRSPFQIPSRPSRAVLRNIQLHLDSFLKIMLSHPTFSTHELLWEFFLVPDIQPEMVAERSLKKAEIRAERVKEEYPPVIEVKDVELFVGHAREMIRGVNQSTKSVVRRVNMLRNVRSDLCQAAQLSSVALASLVFLPPSHVTAFARFAATLSSTELSPYTVFLYDMQSISSTLLAIISSFSRPQTLITSMSQTSKAIDRHLSSLRRSDRWPLGLLDDTRNKIHQEAAEKVEKSSEELASLASELRYTQQIVAGELAGWQDVHEKMGRRALRTLAQKMVVMEKARLAAMKRAVRGVLPPEEGGPR